MDRQARLDQIRQIDRQICNSISCNKLFTCWELSPSRLPGDSNGLVNSTDAPRWRSWSLSGLTRYLGFIYSYIYIYIYTHLLYIYILQLYIHIFGVSRFKFKKEETTETGFLGVCRRKGLKLTDFDAKHPKLRYLFLTLE